MAGVVSVGDMDARGDEPAGDSMAFANPKSKHLCGAVTPHFDVRGLQITMDDALLVRGFERLRNLLRDRQRLVDRDRAARNALGQIVALDEFHHERGDAVRLSSSPWMAAMCG